MHQAHDIMFLMLLLINRDQLTTVGVLFWGYVCMLWLCIDSKWWRLAATYNGCFWTTNSSVACLRTDNTNSTIVSCLQVLLEVMKRMDTLIFHFLVTPSTDANSEAGSSSLGGDNRSQAYTTPSPQPDRDGVSPTASQNSHSQQQQSSSGFAYDPLNPNMPMLDDSMLFFTRGVLMFGTGMNLKMACTR
eukprot:GHRR01001343.1.p1 GENE.GHRR01001343.1~~GHRR01001343.1.p1  ORF type:complete len:189 (-),score=41.48 GHRR01001343.1:3147-3713(-)